LDNNGTLLANTLLDNNGTLLANTLLDNNVPLLSNTLQNENIIKETNFGEVDTSIDMMGQAVQTAIHTVDGKTGAYIPIPNIFAINNGIPDIIESVGKHQVSFSSSDLNEIKSFSNFTNPQVNNSLTTGSDFSYTKNIKSHNIPHIQPLSIGKNVRINKPKSKKKILDLDEVDYLYNKLQDYIRNMNIDRYNYIIVIIKAMEIIENYDSTNNINKKDVVMKALNRIVMIDLNLDDFDQRLFLCSMSNVIELIISNTNTKPNNNDRKSFATKNDKLDDIILANSGQIIYSIIDKLTTIILKKQYTSDKLFSNFATITDILMILADKYGYLTGFEKKNMVMQAMDKLVNCKLELIIDTNKEQKNDLVKALGSIAMIIDLLIAVQKGKYKINTKQIIIVNKSRWFKSLCGSKYHNYD
jgi:hypothetical protein